MRIAMVSEHASPLAVLGGVDAGGQNVHVAALAAALGRRGARGRGPHAPRRPGAAATGAARARRRRSTTSTPARPRRCRRTSCCRTWARSPTSCAAQWPRRAARRRARALLDVRRWRRSTRPRGLGVPVVHTFHALGVGQAPPPGRATPARRRGSSSSASIAPRGRPRRRHLHATRCSSSLRHGRRPRPASASCPCGVDRRRFTPGRAARSRAAGRRDRVRRAGWWSARASAT